MYLETRYTFQDVQIAIGGVKYSVDGTVEVYGDSSDFTQYTFGTPDIDIVVDMECMEDVEADDTMLPLVAAALDRDPNVRDALEMEWRQWQ